MASIIKSVLLVVLLCGVLCGCGQSAMRISEDKQAIRKLEDEFLVAHSFKSGAKLAEFYTEDALLIPPNEPIVCGKQAIAEWYEREFEKAPLIEDPSVTLDEVEVFSNLAFIRGNFILKFKGETGNEPIFQNLRFVSIWGNKRTEAGNFTAIYGAQTLCQQTRSSGNEHISIKILR